jgi:UDP-N-acetyl-D-glucosamine dehydrogenase
MKKVCVFGLGYVGLPISIAANKAGYDVLGFDTNEQKINDIKYGSDSIQGISRKLISEVFDSNQFDVTKELSTNETFDVVLICVPTPLNHERKPDLSYLLSAVRLAASCIRVGSLIVIESTVETGTTRNIILPMIKSISSLNENQFFLAFSPERIDPANTEWNIKNTPKLISGSSRLALDACEKFYSRFIDTIIKCNSLEVAETAKLLENTFRLINISFINEILVYCQKLGVSIEEVIEAASTKPYGFMKFKPSIGVGGHCIPVDPLYLANKALEIGSPTRFIELADKINQEMPLYFVRMAEEKVISLKNKKVLVIGVAYKPNVDDTRETPVFSLIKELERKGAKVSWHDELVQEWNGGISAKLDDFYDLAILATHHDYLDLTKLGAVPVLNIYGIIE